VRNIVSPPKPVPSGIDVGDQPTVTDVKFVARDVKKNCLLFQLSLCCDVKWLVFVSVLFCNIKIFKSRLFVPSLQQARYVCFKN
jgi:hypothetical protein